MGVVLIHDDPVTTAPLGTVARGIGAGQDVTDGSVVGTQPLAAGTHEDVTVDFDPAAFPEDSSTVGLHAQLYADDGDGEFTGDDRLLRAGDSPVSSYFLVWQVDEEPTTQSGEPTAGPNSTVGGTDEADTDTEPSTEPPQNASKTGVPGFGVGHAAVALVAVVALTLARR